MGDTAGRLTFISSSMSVLSRPCESLASLIESVRVGTAASDQTLAALKRLVSGEAVETSRAASGDEVFLAASFGSVG